MKIRLSQIVSLQTELLFCLIATECSIVFASIYPDNLCGVIQISFAAGRREEGGGGVSEVQSILFSFCLEIKRS